MTMARRLAAAAGAGVLALLTVASPARADHPPEVALTSPAARDAPGPVTGTISVDEDEGQTLSEVTFAVVLEDPDAPNDPDDPCFVDLPTDKKVQTFDPAVKVTEASFDFDLDFPCNRAYKLLADVSYENPGVFDLAPAPREPAQEPAALSFSVAIRPVQVKGLEAVYDSATREVALTWAPNPEPDIVGYHVERSPAGQSRFTRISGDAVVTDTAFRDPDVGEGQIYRIIAVRPEPPEGRIESEPSRFVRSGPEAPDLLAAPSGPSNAGGNRSGDRSGPARPPSRTRTTADTGFDQALPFDPSRTTIPSEDLRPEPPGDAAVLAEFDDVSDDEQRRATLVPVAGGLALIVGALHLFLLSKRAGESDIPIVPR